MKKLYTFFALSGLFIVSAIAQPTLTNANYVPAINDNQLYYVADTNSIIDPIIGANVIFDYTGLRGYGMSQTQYIIDPSTTPNAASFPSATYADTSDVGAVNTRYTEVVGVDSIINIGFVAELPTYGTVVATYDINPEILMKFPFNYGDNYNDPYAGTFTLQAATTEGNGDATVNADAWGQLQLPLGVTIDSVLRVKTVEYLITDTINIPFPPVTINPVEVNATYINYYKPSISKFPLLSFVTGSIKQDGAIIDSNKTFISQYPLPGVGVEELHNNLIEFNLFPNPSNQENVTLTIILKENTSLKIDLLNNLGQKVRTIHNSNVMAGKNEFVINTHNLSAGVYFINTIINGTSVAKKLVIQ